MKKNYLYIFCLCCLLTSFVQAEEKDLEQGIRGVWVPAPRFTSVLHTYQNVIKFIDKLDELNMNSIFLVSYAGPQTIYKSDVLTKHSTYSSSREGYMLASYADKYNIPLQSPTNDPIRDLLDEAHKRNIKVFFWFEYGFMGDGKEIAATNPILAKNPSWLGLGNDKKASNYNKHDYYFNAYNPNIQEFIIQLIEEALTLYPDLDGIQGDDRMPAMPRNSGYDDYTIERYKSEHNGKNPPIDFNEKSWVRWRLDILNEFGKTLYARVKAKSSNAFVSFAPNPYPWCEQMLMQEWPRWCKDGICDLLAVQCYRYNVDAYRATVSQVQKYAMKNNPQQLLAPGIILMEGNTIKMNSDILKKQLIINRELGIKSEIFFYNEAINAPQIAKTLKEMYTKKISFPTLKESQISTQRK